MQIKQWLIILLTAALMACTPPTAQEIEKERKDKEAARINVQLAAGYIRRGDLEIAKTKLIKAIEFDKKYVPAYTTMAVLMTMVDDPVEAENYYLEALNIDPRNPELRNNYGTFLCANGKYDEAFKQFDKALKNQFYETPEAAHANIGYCLMQGERPNYRDAEKHLRKALSLQPNMTTALLAMGELGIKTKKYLMARAYMQRYHHIVKPDAHSLWLQIQAEHALGDKKFFISLSRELLKSFPESPEAEMVMELSDK